MDITLFSSIDIGGRKEGRKRREGGRVPRNWQLFRLNFLPYFYLVLKGSLTLCDIFLRSYPFVSAIIAAKTRAYSRIRPEVILVIHYYDC